MNCHGFESLINDLARDQMMDAAIKTKALAHSETCARCAARLADERMLTAGLHRLAASAVGERAPERIEQMLLAAFGESRTQSAQTSIATARSSAWRWAVAAAVAAILVLVALVALRSEKKSQPEQVVHREQQPQPTAPAQPDEIQPAVPGFKDRAANNSANRRSASKRSPQLAKGSSRNEKPDAQKSAPDPRAGTNEIATDFIPIMQGEILNHMDGGQIVRVELPRTALMSFGLPMNMERADERIKADVVIGNDGLARAIRFVR